MDGTEYITLKEAGEISGYSPDYIGQLIRRGKITGKQVYANVAWVTTRDALGEYLSEKGKSKKEVVDQEPTSEATSPSVEIQNTIEQGPLSLNEREGREDGSSDIQRWERLFMFASRLTIIIATLFLVFLFHVFSTLLDDRLERRALERVSVSVPTLIP